MNSRTALVSVFGIVSIFALGCSANVDSQRDEPAQLESALEAENGGLDTSDEAPAFGDEAVRALEGFEPRFADANDMTTSAQVTGARSYTVAVMWGHLPPARDAEASDVDPAAMDWSGSIAVDAGAIGVKKTLRFDREDAVAPRTDARSVSFRSRTLPHVDGLLLRVVLPPSGDATLHFKSASLDTNIDLSALATKAGGAQRLADGRNGVAWVGFPDVAGCSRGFLFGRWNKVRPQLGTFRGRVADASGDALGHVRGLWGHSPKKDKDVFFGKYVSLDGQHRGLFAGAYAQGGFAGIWGVRSPAEVGTLEGVYSDGYSKDDGRGMFLGRWSERCQAR